MQHLLSIATLGGLLLLGACQERVGERAENLGPHVHRLTVDIVGKQPAEDRLAKLADAVCPSGYSQQGDELMPPEAPSYRVWLVRCK
jgi:hypothetical protein